MQSKISFFNLTLFKQNIKRAWPVALFYMLFMLVEQPVIMGNALSYGRGAYGASDVIDILDMSGEVASLAVAAILIVVVVFSYLYNSRHANMMHSFPVNRTAHFGSGVLACLSLLWAAEVIISLVSSVVLVMHDCTSVLSAVFIWLLVKAINTVFFVGLAVFCAMFVGQRVYAAILYVVLNGIYCGLYLIVYMFSGIFMFGFTRGSMEFYEFLTPVYELSARIGFSYRIVDFVSREWVDWRFEGMIIAAVYAAIGVVLIIIGLVAYKFRKVETAGDFISFDWLKPIYKIVAAAGLSLFVTGICVEMVSELFGGMGYNSTFAVVIFITIVAGFVVFFAVEMLIRRSFRVFNKKQWLVWAIYSVVMILGLFCLKSDLFGFQKHVPDISEIDYSYFELGGMSYTDGDNEEVVELHQAIVDRIEDLRDEASENAHNSYWESINVSYWTNDDTYIARSYEIYPESLAGSEIANVVDEIFSRTDVQKQMIFETEQEDSVITSLEVELFDFYSNGEYTAYFQEYDLNLQQSRQLVHALMEDVEAGNVRMTRGNWNNDYDETRYMNDLVLHFANTIVEQDEDGVEMETERDREAMIYLTRDSVNTLGVLCDMLGITPENFVENGQEYYGYGD